MAPAEDANGMTYAQRYQDAILSNSGLTDGLTDDQAKPFIDWMMKQAEHVGAMVENDEDYEAKLVSLNRLILFISRFVQRRHEHINDTVWVDTQIGRLNEYSSTLGGSGMPEDMHQRYQDTSAKSHEDVLKEMMDVYNLTTHDQKPSTDDDTRPMTRAELGIGGNLAIVADAEDDAEGAMETNPLSKELTDSLKEAADSNANVFSRIAENIHQSINPSTEGSEEESADDDEKDKGLLSDLF